MMNNCEASTNDGKHRWYIDMFQWSDSDMRHWNCSANCYVGTCQKSFQWRLVAMKSSHTTDCHKWNFVGWKQIWNVLPSQDLSWWRVFSSNKSYLANLVLLLLIQLAQFRHKRNDKELSLSSSTRAFNHLQTSFGCWMRWALCTHEEEKPVRETDGCIHECKKDLEKDSWCCTDWKRKTGKTS